MILPVCAFCTRFLLVKLLNTFVFTTAKSSFHKKLVVIVTVIHGHHLYPSSVECLARCSSWLCLLTGPQLFLARITVQSIWRSLLLSIQHHLSVCLSVCLFLGHNGEPYKNGWTDGDAIRFVDTGGPKEPIVRTSLSSTYMHLHLCKKGVWKDELRNFQHVNK